VFDSHERDRAKARNVGIVGDKAVSAVRRLECDAQASFCHDRVKVASNWMLVKPFVIRAMSAFGGKADITIGCPLVICSRPDCAAHHSARFFAAGRGVGGTDKAALEPIDFASARARDVQK
jgi:hypothetical protein